MPQETHSGCFICGRKGFAKRHSVLWGEDVYLCEHHYRSLPINPYAYEVIDSNLPAPVSLLSSSMPNRGDLALT